MKAPAFQFYPDSWLSSQRVQMMTLEEEGAYIRLISFCWRHGSVPSDPELAARLIGKGASTTVATVVLAMFVPSDQPGRMVHDRLEHERSKQAEWRAKSSVGGKKSADMRKGALTTLQPPLQNGSNQKATLPSPTPTPTPTLDSNSLFNHNPPASPAHDPALIEAIYSLYPRKQAKQHALKAIRAALKVSTAAHLTERVQAYAEAVSAWSLHDRQFVPHPATWFNAGSYDDDPQTWQRIPAGANRHQMPAATKADHAMNNGGWGPNQ